VGLGGDVPLGLCVGVRRNERLTATNGGFHKCRSLPASVMRQ
jgi:hypothetical protein